MTVARVGIDKAAAELSARMLSNVLTCRSSSRRIWSSFARYGCSQAKNLITRIPPRSSWMSFARLSVHTIALIR